MQLSPLQSRLAASLAASLFILALYLLLQSPNFALAAELHDAPEAIYEVTEREPMLDEALDTRSRLEPTYEPEFAPFGRSIIGRAPAGVTALVNNVPVTLNLQPGTTSFFTFEADQIFGPTKRSVIESENGSNTRASLVDRSGLDYPGSVGEDDFEDVESRFTKRQLPSRTVYISANTCMQPQRLIPAATTMDPPQLTLFISTSSTNPRPAPKMDMSDETFEEFEEGAVMYELNATGTMFIGVSAPNISTDYFGGIWNFQIAASVNGLFHAYDNSTSANRLLVMDSDSSSALLVTTNLTSSTDPAVIEEVMQASPPYVMFAAGVNDTTLNGVRNSFCGLQNYAAISAMQGGKFTNTVSMTMTTRGPGGLPKQQFLFSDLNASTWYTGILAAAPGSPMARRQIASGGSTSGVRVFGATQFQTKQGDNCKIITNLDFCSDITYAVPSNNNNFPNATALAQFYDQYAQTMFGYFQNVLAQIPCEAPSTEQYSLVRNCDNCTDAYRRWLCAVTIPKCEDFTSDNDFALPRAVNASFPNGTFLAADVINQFPLMAYRQSRNPLIDQVVAPGPYKEVLPCDSLCYELVQSCPAYMQFACPLPGRTGYNTSYGQVKVDGVSCNYPGVPQSESAAPGRHVVPWITLFVAAGLLLVASI